MNKILFLLMIFMGSLAFEASATASPEPTPAAGGAFWRDGVNHSSAKRFKTPRRGRISRNRFTCLRKHGCTGSTRRAKHAKDTGNCKKSKM